MQRCFSKSYSTNLHFKWIIELNKSNTFGEVKSPGSKQILKSLEKMKLWQFRQLDFTVIPTLRLPHSVWKQRVNNADNVWAAWLSSGLCERSVVVSRIEVSSWSEALYSVCCDWTQMWTVKYSGTSGRIAFPLLRGCHDKMPVMHRAHKRLVKVWVILYFQRSSIWISCCVICWVMCMLKHGSKIWMWSLSLSKLLEL